MFKHSHNITNSEQPVHSDHHLALDRTILANERTLLAYVRTFLTLLAAGVSFVQFFRTLALQVTGWILALSSVGVLVIGIARFFRMRAYTGGVRKTCGKPFRE